MPLCERCHGLVHAIDMRGHGATTKAALQAKRARGEKTGGSIPYGYCIAADGKHLVAVEHEQQVIAMVRTARAAGMSLRQIGRTLLFHDIKPRTEGTVWHPKAIDRIIKAAPRTP